MQRLKKIRVYPGMNSRHIGNGEIYLTVSNILETGEIFYPYAIKLGPKACLHMCNKYSTTLVLSRPRTLRLLLSRSHTLLIPLPTSSHISRCCRRLRCRGNSPRRDQHQGGRRSCCWRGGGARSFAKSQAADLEHHLRLALIWILA